MKLQVVDIKNYRAIDSLELVLNPSLNVLHGYNAHGKTSVLSAIAVGLGSILRLLPDVKSIDFRKSDRRQQEPGYTHVKIVTQDGLTWERSLGSSRRYPVLRELKELLDTIVSADREGLPSTDLPIVAFYDTDRAAFDQSLRRRDFQTNYSRYAALSGALSARTDYNSLFRWFYTKENEELREQRRLRDFTYKSSDLEVVRKAIASMVPGGSDPRMETSPLRFVLTLRSEAGESEKLSLDQLSGGYRIILALTADLAWRMAHANPHLENPLEAAGIVLIDEIELHLHPSWQQQVLHDLRRTFPNIQFIVSTHSPQVLTTVKPNQIISLHKKGASLIAGQPVTATYGAEAGNVLSLVMGVSERPLNNEFVKRWLEYIDLINNDAGKTDAARDLRRLLEKLSPSDPALELADIELRRRILLESAKQVS